MHIEDNEIKEALTDFSAGFTESMKERFLRNLTDDRVDYKRSTLLTLVKIYKTPAEAAKAGYSLEKIKHAVQVLRDAGYSVDLANGVIERR